MTYTAADVRGAIETLDEHCEATDYLLPMHRDMLTAYADRLELDAALHRTISISDGLDAERLREEGRREVYREIAAINPYVPCDSSCAFCFYIEDHLPAGAHHAKCLWLRATAALRETTPTP